VAHVGTAPHETRGSLLYDQHEVSPYWALRRLYQSIDGGLSGLELELPRWQAPGTETWEVSLNYHPSGLEPRPSDDVQTLNEYDIQAYGDGQRKLPICVKPRLGWDDCPERRPQSVPADLGPATAVALQNVVNIDLDEIAWLIPRLFEAVADEIGLSWNSDYFTGEPHPFSTITQHERYLRIEREQAKKLTRADGIFPRLFHVAAQTKGSKAVYSADNREALHWNHQLRLDPESASELFPGRRRGYQAKRYLPEHVGDRDDDDPLKHPKLGLLFKKGLNGDTAVPWSERHDLTHELEETALNLCSWASVPTKPGQWYVADDHFDASESDRQVAFYDDPTPEMEAEQESVLVRTLSRLTESDRDVLDRLARTDGGTHVGEVESEIEWSTSTVYRALQRLDDLLENDNGNVRFVSEKIREKVRDVIGRVDEVVESQTRVIEEVLDMDPRDLERAGRAWQNWLNRYAAEYIENGGHAGRDKLRIRTILSELKALPHPYAPEIAEYGATAWVKSGRDPNRIRNAVVEYDTPDGGTATKRLRDLLRTLH
jgi:hypothetical protein